jgi:hypothetical protein
MSAIYIYTYIGRCYSSPWVMDQRSITWTQWSNRPTEPHAPNRPTPRVRPPCPRYPSDPVSPVRPHVARSTLRRPISHCPTSRPCLLHPTPPPSVSTASCYASRRPTTGERPYLPLPSPLSPAPLPPPPHAFPPTSAVSSYTQRFSHRRPCFLRPCASQNDRENHKMTKEITKSLRKTQND